MQSSCAQDRSILSSRSCTTGIDMPAKCRWITATKISTVAPPIRNEISHSSRWSRIFKTFLPWQAPAPVLWRSRRGRSGLEARLLVDRFDDVLADARLVLLVHGHERL